jgi:hypothetical protein
MALTATKLTPRRKKTVRKTATENFLVNKKYLGAEVPKNDGTQASFARALNWHHQMSSVEDGKEFAIEWLTQKGHKDIAKKVRSIPDNRLPITACWLAGLGLSGWPLTSDNIAKIKKDFVEAISRSPVSDEPIDPEVKIARPSVYDFTLEKIGSVIADIEDVIDRSDFSFSMYSYLQSNEIPQKYVKKILDYYEPLLEEWTQALKGSDPQLKEGYSYLSKAEKQNRVKFLSTLIDDLNRHGENKKQARAPRKKKPVSADRKVVRLKYQEADTVLKLMSIPPANLIGASEVWLYNTKYGIMTRYVAKDQNGIDVKGQTLLNFDEAASCEKRIGRKSEVVTKAVLGATKVQLRKTLDMVKAQCTVPKGRINPNTILLRAVK